MKIPPFLPSVRELVLGVTLGLILMTPGDAHSATCSSRQNILDLLHGRFQEEIVGLGLTNGGALIELTHTEDLSTWTIILTTPEGYTCLLAAGEDWTEVQTPFADPA